MRFSKILLTFSVLLLLAAAQQNVKNGHKSHHLQEKSHRRKTQHEKSAVHNFVIPHKKSELRSQNVHNFHRLFYRNGNSDCSWVCQNETYANHLGLQVYYNGNEQLIGLVNQSNSIALIIDYSSNVAALLNGQTGDSIIADLNSGTIYRTQDSTQENAVWLASKTSFETYFQSLPSLQALLKLAQQNGEKYNFGDIDQPLINEILDALNNLGVLRLSEAVIDVISRFVPYQRIRQFVHYVTGLLSNLPSLENIIPSIFRGANLTEILSNSSNVWSVLSNIPVIGNFIADIAKSNITQYLNPSYVAALINNTHSSEILSRLLPGVDLSNLTNIENILPTILRNVNLTEILSNSSNVWSVLSDIPFIGVIFRESNISHYLNPSSFVENFGQILGNIFNTTSGIASDVEHLPFWNAPFGISYGIQGGVSGTLGTFVGSIGLSSGRKAHHRFQEKKQHNEHHQQH